MKNDRIATTIYIEKLVHAELRRVSYEGGVSIAHLIRKFIDEGLERIASACSKNGK